MIGIKSAILHWLDLWLGTVMSVRVQEKIVALTFDDGPSPTHTEKLLSLLAKYDAKATFFVVGEAAQKNPEFLKRIAEAGHSLGNHSWSHIPIHKLNWLRRYRQIKKCAALLSPSRYRLFRPPFARQSIGAIIQLKLMGYKIIGGNFCIEDWRCLEKNEILRRLNYYLKSGEIFVLHDQLYRPSAEGQIDRTQMLEALEIFLQYWRSEYQFVTVDELLNKGTAIQKLVYR